MKVRMYLAVALLVVGMLVPYVQGQSLLVPVTCRGDMPGLTDEIALIGTGSGWTAPVQLNGYHVQAPSGNGLYRLTIWTKFTPPGAMEVYVFSLGAYMSNQTLYGGQTYLGATNETEVTVFLGLTFPGSYRVFIVDSTTRQWQMFTITRTEV